MQRELKFRAWDESQKYMAYQGTPDLETIKSFMYHFGDKELMLFTGLHDKDGNNICVYDGDIVDLHGNLIGNKYENADLLKDQTNLLIEGFGTKTWTQTEQAGLARGLKYSE